MLLQNIMIQIVELILGSFLVFISIRSYISFSWNILGSVSRSSARTHRIARLAFRFAVGLIGFHLFLDPLVPGRPTFIVHAPERYAGLPANLRTRIAPVKIDGTIDLARQQERRFADNGMATLTTVLHVLEQNVYLEIYDLSRSGPPIQTAIVRTSIYERRGLNEVDFGFSPTGGRDG